MTTLRHMLEAVEADRRLFIGLMSGTSVDGVDAVVVELDGVGPGTRVRLIRHQHFSYDHALRERILTTCEGSVREVCELNFILGEEFAQAVAAIATSAGIPMAMVTAVVSPGQTVWHVDRSQRGVPSTLQVGEASVIAQRTGVAVISDLRVADVAAGGAGAPLVPYADWIIGSRPGEVRAFQNIGGIANVTVITEACENVLAFDTGPGNMLIDEVAHAVTCDPDQIDQDGSLSDLGTVDTDLLERLLAHPYFALSPPKSTGRELFGRQMARRLITSFDQGRLLDLLATVVQFTADSIGNAYRDFVYPRLAGQKLEEVVVSGGGARNLTLMEALTATLAPVLVRAWDADEMGFPSEAKEAVAFCILANESLAGRPANLPAATGARAAVSLGKLVLP